MDIDLTTKEKIKFRFNQLCAYFAIQVRNKTEPQSVYLELYQVANALEEKYIHGGDERFDEKRREAIDTAIECLKKENKS